LGLPETSHILNEQGVPEEFGTFAVIKKKLNLSLIE
jgi:hypothetical protein